MKSDKVRYSGPTAAQVVAYGVAASRACSNMGIIDAEGKKRYRHGVVEEVTGHTSFKDIRSNADVDAVMSRLWTDAGDYLQASSYAVNGERQLAYVIKVLALQLMQLKSRTMTDARAYLGGVLDQARIPNGRDLSSDSYWLDIRTDQLSSLLKILDTERRRILTRARFRRTAFSDRIVYVTDDEQILSTTVPSGYYAAITFKVNILQ